MRSRASVHLLLGRRRRSRGRRSRTMMMMRMRIAASARAHTHTRTGACRTRPRGMFVGHPPTSPRSAERAREIAFRPDNGKQRAMHPLKTLETKWQHVPARGLTILRVHMYITSIDPVAQTRHPGSGERFCAGFLGLLVCATVRPTVPTRTPVCVSINTICRRSKTRVQWPTRARMVQAHLLNPLWSAGVPRGARGAPS